MLRECVVWICLLVVGFWGWKCFFVACNMLILWILVLLLFVILSSIWICWIVSVLVCIKVGLSFGLNCIKLISFMIWFFWICFLIKIFCSFVFIFLNMVGFFMKIVRFILKLKWNFWLVGCFFIGRYWSRKRLKKNYFCYWNVWYFKFFRLI